MHASWIFSAIFRGCLALLLSLAPHLTLADTKRPRASKTIQAPSRSSTSAHARAGNPTSRQSAQRERSFAIAGIVVGAALILGSIPLFLIKKERGYDEYDTSYSRPYAAAGAVFLLGGGACLVVSLISLNPKPLFSSSTPRRLAALDSQSAISIAPFFAPRTDAQPAPSGGVIANLRF